MAGSVNKVIILGHLGANPELKYIPSGQAVCEMRIATSDTYKDRNEQQQERTEWHRVTIWGKMAENCAKYLQKGRQVYIEGKLQTRSWDDKEGKKQYMTEILANQVVFLGGGGEGQGHGGEERRGDSGGSAGTSGGRQASSRGAAGPSGQQRMAQAAAPANDDFGGVEDEEIPF